MLKWHTLRASISAYFFFDDADALLKHRKHPLLDVKSYGIMESKCINRVELQGVVGTARMGETGSGRFVRFSLATNYAYRMEDGTPVIETTWHNCIAFEDKHVTGFDMIEKGAAVHLVGRIRCSRYVGIDNVERTSMEIVVKSLEVQ